MSSTGNGSLGKLASRELIALQGWNFYDLKSLD